MFNILLFLHKKKKKNLTIYSRYVIIKLSRERNKNNFKKKLKKFQKSLDKAKPKCYNKA